MNQWRAYSKDGLGLNLGLDIGENVREIDLKHLFTNWKNFLEGGGGIDYYTWHQIKIEYISESASNNIETYVYDSIVWIKNKYGENPAYNSDFRNDIEVIAYYLWIISLGIKDSAFEAEDEYRLFMIAPIQMDTAEYCPEFLKDQLNYKATDFGLKPYLKFKFQDKLKLTQVMTGPKFKGSLWDIQDFLRKNDFLEAVVEPSKVPYK